MIGKPLTLQLFVLWRNRPDFARQAIQCAIRQTVNRFEILISDNSTDNSVESLLPSEFSDLENRRRTNGLGVFDHLDQCLNQATADYVGLFHDDDLPSLVLSQLSHAHVGCDFRPIEE